MFKSRKRKLTVVTFFQSLYLTVSFFLSNDLFSYASSCSFGFLFSFTPFLMLILAVLIRFLHASPETVTSILENLGKYFEMLDVKEAEKTVSSLLKVENITSFEIILVVCIIILACRFVTSILSSLRKIFWLEQKNKPIASQFIVILIEAILIVLFSSLIFIFITMQTVITMPAFEPFANKFSDLLNSVTSTIMKNLPYVFVFCLTFIAYKIGSRTKPPFFMSAFFAMLCTFSLYIYLTVALNFINMKNYNVIYGVLGNLIILLFCVFVFFVIFLFFAQWLFVYQFFDILLLCELYILPERDNIKLFATIKRSLFIRPDNILLKNANVISLKRGSSIYTKGQDGTDAFYIVEGTVKIERQNHVNYAEKGSFFGEEACLLNEIRNEDAIALTDVKIIKIPEDIFFSLLEHNPQVSKKALAQISKYFSKLYITHQMEREF